MGRAGSGEGAGADFALQLPLGEWLEADDRLDEETLRQRVVEHAQTDYEARYAHVGQQMRDVERQIMLQVLDNQWKDHLANMDQLRQGIGLRAYAQKNPKQEYKRESFEMFENLLNNIKFETVRLLSHIRVTSEEDMRTLEEQRRQEQQGREYQHAASASLTEDPAAGTVKSPGH